MDGLSVLEAVLEEAPGLPAIVVTGFGTIDSAVEAMKRGASDFLTKPIQVENLLAALDRSIERAGASGAVSTPPSVASAEMARLGIVGESRAMQELFDTLKRMAPYDSTVLILGESGTGKELIARALHALGSRPAGPFVAINCATLSDQILESELFGHEKGAFTSADQAKPGVMETADGGTLFLDEVSEMGLGCQAKLLRAIERREFRRVGGTRKIKVNLRVVAASNVRLEDAVAAGRFRSDLYYRLKVLSLEVPPLRERKEAIPVLAQRLLDEVTRNAHLPAQAPHSRGAGPARALRLARQRAGAAQRDGERRPDRPEGDDRRRGPSRRTSARSGAGSSRSRWAPAWTRSRGRSSSGRSTPIRR